LLTYLAQSPRRLLDDLSSECPQRVEVHTHDDAAPGAVEDSVERWLHELPQCEAVLGRDEMEGASHERDADERAIGEQLRDLLGVEVIQSRPQADVP